MKVGDLVRTSSHGVSCYEGDVAGKLGVVKSKEESTGFIRVRMLDTGKDVLAYEFELEEAGYETPL